MQKTIIRQIDSAQSVVGFDRELNEALADGNWRITRLDFQPIMMAGMLNAMPTGIWSPVIAVAVMENRKAARDEMLDKMREEVARLQQQEGTGRLHRDPVIGPGRPPQKGD